MIGLSLEGWSSQNLIHPLRRPHPPSKPIPNAPYPCNNVRTSALGSFTTRLSRSNIMVARVSAS